MGSPRWATPNELSCEFVTRGIGGVTDPIGRCASFASAFANRSANAVSGIFGRAKCTVGGGFDVVGGFAHRRIRISCDCVGRFSRFVLGVVAACGKAERGDSGKGKENALHIISSQLG